jgi:hypothetical protein
MSWEQACKISRDYAIAGIQNISPLPRDSNAKPLRFIYMSGTKAERDQTKKPFLLREYCLMRVRSKKEQQEEGCESAP